MGTGGIPSATRAQSPSGHRPGLRTAAPRQRPARGRRAGGFAPHLQGFVKQHLKMRSEARTSPGAGWALPSLSIRGPIVFMQLLLSPHVIL